VRARLSEQYTLAIIDALVINYSNAVTNSALFQDLGGVPDLVTALLVMFQSSTYDTRANDRAGYTLYMDTSMMEVLQISEMRASAAKTDGSQAGIMRFILQNVDPIQSVVMVKDRIPGAYGTVQANGNPKAVFPADNGAVVALPDLVRAGRLRVIPTAEAFFFGTGEIRTGVKQDFSQARQNITGWFAEEAFAGTKYGTLPWFAINASISARGFYTGTVNRNVTATETEAAATAYIADNAAPNVVDPAP
jgi:hypothetical protein